MNRPSSVSYIMHEGEPDNQQACVLAYIPNVLPNDLVSSLQDEFKTYQFHSGNMENGSTIDRKQIWFQNDGHYFCKKWVNRYPRWEAHRYPSSITRVQDYLQDKLMNELADIHSSIHPITLNSCLLNWYQDGTQFIPPHRDSADSFGENPMILGVSIGAERTFRLVRKKTPHQEYTLRLAHNSLFMMAGATQQYYLHEILPEKECKQERWSLTFRQYIDIE